MKSIFTSIAVLCALSCYSQKSILTGVITYFFNNNFGDKPDVGAKIYIIPASDKTAEAHFKAIDSLVAGYQYRVNYLKYISEYRTYAALAEKTEGKKRLKEHYDNYIQMANTFQKASAYDSAGMYRYGTQTEENLRRLDARCSDGLFYFSSKGLNTTVDGNGRYSLDIPAGEYYVVIISNNRKALIASQILGMVYTKPLLVKSDQSTEVSHRFPLL